jgi:hypothetical protein
MTATSLSSPRCPQCAGELETSPISRRSQGPSLLLCFALAVLGMLGLLPDATWRPLLLLPTMIVAALLLYAFRTKKWFRCKQCARTFTRSELAVRG